MEFKFKSFNLSSNIKQVNITQLCYHPHEHHNYHPYEHHNYDCSIQIINNATTQTFLEKLILKCE